MSGDSSQMIAEIQAAIKTGMLTHSEIERRLEAAINAEIGKEDSPADIELIRACQSLLWELDTQGNNAFVDNTEESLAAFKAKRTNAVEPKGWKLHFAYRVVASAAAILLIIFGLDALLYYEGLDGESTEDQQQYIISGHKTDLGIVNESQAGVETAEPQSITTTNLDEAIEVLGFVPAMPQWLPEGWELLSYDVFKTEPSNWFTVTYSNTKQAYALIYHIVYYSDIEQAQAVFEQSRAGEEYILANGKTVYISKNLDDTTCVWYEDLACYNLIGPEDVNTFLEIIQSIKESP